MPTDLTVILEHGQVSWPGWGRRDVVHVLLDDQTVARCQAALERAGIGIADEREVLVVEVEDRPPTLTSTPTLPTPRSAA